MSAFYDVSPAILLAEPSKPFEIVGMTVEKLKTESLRNSSAKYEAEFPLV